MILPHEHALKRRCQQLWAAAYGQGFQAACTGPVQVQWLCSDHTVHVHMWRHPFPPPKGQAPISALAGPFVLQITTHTALSYSQRFDHATGQS